MSNTHLVVTSIAAPNPVLRSLAAGCRQHGARFTVIGDVKSPPGFALPGCDFYSVEQQVTIGFRFAAECPTRHYARKNIGYLIAVRDRAELIVETDDDNFPGEGFWAPRQRRRALPLSSGAGWVNVYRYFTESNIWPRGLPLDAVSEVPAGLGTLPTAEVDAPIQQGLADENPDVDAIYRLVLPLPQSFAPGRAVALGRGSWCPFNSQNTSWWPDAFPLLYLPAYCSFRMTDIWRSFVAQRIAWENGWTVAFDSATVWQERNDHNLMRDFNDEVVGYQHNRSLCEQLEATTVRAGAAEMGDNLRRCYEVFVRAGAVEEREFSLLEAWLEDLRAVR